MIFWLSHSVPLSRIVFQSCFEGSNKGTPGLLDVVVYCHVPPSFMVRILIQSPMRPSKSLALISMVSEQPLPAQCVSSARGYVLLCLAFHEK